jgi:16S rRNA (adenine1518-N6/adenine1519-N6)-dimethyltransferase
VEGDAGDGLLSPADIRRLCTTLALRPTKSLGQNFLIDPNTIRRIVRIADVAGDAAVVEVGPGLGSLTLGLLAAGPEVVAVEIDAVLAGALDATVRERLPGAADRLAVLTADALTVRELPGEPPTALVANLPYNVAVPVLLTLLERFPSIRHGLVMVQQEVADRLVAPPGSRTYGVPSAKLAWYAEARQAGSISRSVFWPVPNVDSGLVGFTRREPPGVPDGVPDRVATFAVVDAAFSQRRKTLRAALAGWAGSAAAAETALRAAGVDPSLRGEALGIEQFAAIAAHRPPRS